ncbi:hypothetical protein [Leifsonia sp. Leaf264]|uniref:hypothetical protein n=1 Tax=Leifsonia sp. Leaf264 TaxID=1736314 RepID=UPI0006F71122|nr:hypothetical protein [Leifsonia sp. Leaf264]KQO98295.1 hypothetical protein ASF30_09555 [Leifsonia sp. Leaf264]
MIEKYRIALDLRKEARAAERDMNRAATYASRPWETTFTVLLVAGFVALYGATQAWLVTAGGRGEVTEPEHAAATAVLLFGSVAAVALIVAVIRSVHTLVVNARHRGDFDASVAEYQDAAARADAALAELAPDVNRSGDMEILRGIWLYEAAHAKRQAKVVTRTIAGNTFLLFGSAVFAVGGTIFASQAGGNLGLLGQAGIAVIAVAGVGLFTPNFKTLLTSDAAEMRRILTANRLAQSNLAVTQPAAA